MLAHNRPTFTGKECPTPGFPLLFVRLLALTVLIYCLRVPQDGVPYIPVILLSWASLLWPGCFLLRCCWSVTFMLAYVGDSPVYSNFLTVIFFCHLLMLLLHVSVWLRAISQRTTGKPLVVNALVLRQGVLWIVVTTYLFAVLHKFNTTFLDPELSPTTEMLQAMVSGDHPGFLGWIIGALAELGLQNPMLPIYGTLVIELTIPVFLLFPRLQPVAFLLDLCMHLLFGFRMWPISTNFPLFMLAAFSVLLRDDRIALPGVHGFGKRSRLLQAIVFSAGSLFLLGGGVDWSIRQMEFSELFLGWFRSLLYLALFILFLVLIVTSFRSRRFRGREIWIPVPMFSGMRPVHWFFPLLLTLNALAPYSGFKTRTSIEMYSGLEVREGRNNHIFIPSSLIVFHYSSGWVKPMESNVPLVQERIYHGFLIAPVEVRRALAGHPEGWLTYEFEGKSYDSRSSPRHPFPIRDRPSWWERKLVNLMPLKPE